MIDEMMIFKDGFGFQDISRKVLSDVQIDVKVITGVTGGPDAEEASVKSDLLQCERACR